MRSIEEEMKLIEMMMRWILTEISRSFYIQVPPAQIKFSWTQLRHSKAKSVPYLSLRKYVECLATLRHFLHPISRTENVEENMAGSAVKHRNIGPNKKAPES